jgi:hypothetical protein
LPWAEANLSPPCSTWVKNAWIYTSTLSFAFMMWHFKHNDNFTTYLIII